MSCEVGKVIFSTCDFINQMQYKTSVSLSIGAFMYRNINRHELFELMSELPLIEKIVEN